MEDTPAAACALPTPAVSTGNPLDLTSDEDLGIGIMNLISIEEHLFFTASKTGKTHYLGLLLEVREMRKQLLQQIVVTFEGEVWCISKHLLASSMRLMEVGTKELKVHGVPAAQPYFEKSYRLFRMFWEVVLQPASGTGQPAHTVPAAKKDVTLYYEPGCPHCAVLEQFLGLHHLDDTFNIVRKDVTSDPANRAAIALVREHCLQGAGAWHVPVVVQAGACAMGEEATIRLFKSLMWDDVKTFRQSVATVTEQAKLPPHVTERITDYNAAVDAALKCCSE